MEISDTELIKTMQRVIRGLRDGRVPIHQFATELDVGLSTLKDVDDNWKKEARKEWLVIEEVNALSLDTPDMKLSDDNRQIVIAAAQRLETLLKKAERKL